MRIALIGTGWVTSQHLAALRGLPVDVVGLAGRNAARLAELTAGSATPTYADYRKLVEREKPDGVFVLLPPYLHGELEVYLADHVAGVLVEKPLANALAPALAALAAFERAGTLVSVAYQNRYRQGVRRAKQRFAAGDKPVLVNGWWVGDRPGPAWWSDRGQSGGQFVEQCTHVVDLARYLAGDIVQVQAFGTATTSAAQVEDAVTVNVRFAGGALGTFQTGCFLPPGSAAAPGVGLSVASASLHARFTGWGFEAELVGAERELYPAEGDVFARQAGAFVEALRTGDRSLVACDYADGLASLRVGLAANRSLELGGQPVAP